MRIIYGVLFTVRVALGENDSQANGARVTLEDEGLGGVV